jgi:formylglycine-generating enzyme required for sulfatase activity
MDKPSRRPSNRAGAFWAALVLVATGAGGCQSSDETKTPAPATKIEDQVAAPEVHLPAGFADFFEQLATDTGINLVPIPAGTFTMGSPLGEAGREGPSEGPQTRVTLTKDFYLGATDVTQGQYELLMKHNPSHFQSAGKDAPVENVSWDDAMAFCRALNAREEAAGKLPAGHAFTLPTEAQWEYACRAGTTGPYAGDPDKMAWYDRNSDGTTHQVATKRGNAWGLFDMQGNVWQWCLDWYVYRSYPGGGVTDPSGPAAPLPALHVYRGGAWNGDASYCRSAKRGGNLPILRDYAVGFRVALGVRQ